MANIEPASIPDAYLFAAMEQAEDTKQYILPYTEVEHAQNMLAPSFVYLRILDADELVGFMILVLDLDMVSVEFRRIVIRAKSRGVGQSAIAEMEQFCLSVLQRQRVWLDVFEYNSRGRHIYEKLGYKNCGQGEHKGKKLLIYDKEL
ncbi:GNAT family N-acetyltransferase [Halomonas sp. ISL-60]|uniref:GNAT family N-acetyltransferase n=1 Tax=Halomonas sp. ISL-56 TaxID=2819149 RepID=UPI001BE7E60F|nr:GNAT family N-acetyltransferase [Halomonas sp. ISL-56]MBT2774280.1 GNAT family N-acetyltransferase [Halomonas sp. ISL-60]MBT2803070.1 GNAT family N-acetyltransferase [Halomonas sp. ISL-56]